MSCFGFIVPIATFHSSPNCEILSFQQDSLEFRQGGERLIDPYNLSGCVSGETPTLGKPLTNSTNMQKRVNRYTCLNSYIQGTCRTFCEEPLT